MKKQNIILILLIFILQGCASSKSISIMNKEKIRADKIISIDGTTQSWRFEIEKRLRKNGFKIKRFTSQNNSIKKVSENKIETYTEASTRYILNVNGYAPDTKMTRCYGGGYDFNYINVELIDVLKNETVFYYSNSGFSEGCQPLSGHIFTDIESLIIDSWE